MYVEISGFFRDRPLATFPPMASSAVVRSLPQSPRPKQCSLSLRIVGGPVAAATAARNRNHNTPLSGQSRIDIRSCSCTLSTLLRPTAPRSPADRPTLRLCSTRSNPCSRSPRRSPFLPPRPTPLSTPVSLPTPIMSTSTSLPPTGLARSSQLSTLPPG